MASLCVSLYLHNQQKSYFEFPVTKDGLAKAGEMLSRKTVNGFRYSLSDWQFADPFGGDIEKAYQLIKAKDVEGLRNHLNQTCPQI